MRIRRGLLTIQLVVAGLVLVLLVLKAPLLISLFEETRAVKAVFRAYASAVMDGDFAGAYEFCGNAFREAMTLDEFEMEHKGQLARYGKLLGIKEGRTEIKITSSSEGWVAVIEATHEYQRKRLPVTYVFHHENGGWVLFACEAHG